MSHIQIRKYFEVYEQTLIPKAFIKSYCSTIQKYYGYQEQSQNWDREKLKKKLQR